MESILDKLMVFNDFKFDEKHHIYYYKGKPISTSVTRFIERFKEKFDEDHWSEKKAKEAGVSQTEMLKRWNEKKRISQSLGTAIHAAVELLFNNKIFTLDKEWLMANCDHPAQEKNVEDEYNSIYPVVLKFYEKAKDTLVPIKLELVVGSADLDIAGCVDGLFWNKKQNEYQIWDWKTNGKFKTINPYQRLFSPFEDLEETSLSEYSLQLSIYKYLIQSLTGIEIGSCFLCHFDRENRDFTFYKTYDLVDRIEKVFEEDKLKRKEGIND